ncbi:hypothetical protein GCK32_012501 [Trichostrongylus colubriformis]|uniref:Uncharacterized protein n=1 Tax=Trichostrongylus colubriformis TaxID=6319 RepID=A0AAN8IE09_TRICO
MHEKPSSQNIDFLEENYVYRGRVNGLNIHVIALYISFTVLSRGTEQS